MKTLAYEVVFRLKDTTNEQIINKGVLIAYFDDKNHFKFLEGLLTNDYIYGKVKDKECVLNLYSSYILYELYSAKDTVKLTEELVNKMEIYWKGIIKIEDLEFPFSKDFELEYPYNNEVIKEEVNISCGREISDVDKYKRLIEDFKNNKVFVSS